jgi:beta-fructofuranosidase
VIGWMQNWDTCNLHTKSTPWFGQMSIPRELSIRDGRIYQAPIRELEALRSDPVRYRDVLVEDTEISLKGVEGRLVDLTLEIEPVEGKELYRKFALRFAQNETFHTGVSFRPYESIVKIDRKFSGSRRAIIHQRRAAVNHDHGRIKLRLILDRFSAEIFVNDGEKVLTATLYTDMAADGISFMANGAAKIHVTQYTLKEM